MKVIRKSHDDDSMHCDMAQRPPYYGDTETTNKKQCVWYLVADVVAFDGELMPLDRGGQYMWRVCTMHVCNVHAKKREGARQTLAEFFSPCCATGLTSSQAISIKATTSFERS